MKEIYVIGSLRNPRIPELANTLTSEGFEVFADWFAPGPEADDKLRDYTRARGWSYKEALESYAARHIFEFDKHHLEQADAVVLYMPAGKSGHLELGWCLGQGKPGYILFDEEPERYELMLQFATGIFFNKVDLIKELNNVKPVRQSFRYRPSLDSDVFGR